MYRLVSQRSNKRVFLLQPVGIFLLIKSKAFRILSIELFEITYIRTTILSCIVSLFGVFYPRGGGRHLSEIIYPISLILGFRGSGAQGFMGSGVQGFRGSWVQGFRGSGVQGLRGSGVQGFRGSGAQGLRSSGVQGLRGSGMVISSLPTVD
jgi:hypothetical protein